MTPPCVYRGGDAEGVARQLLTRYCTVSPTLVDLHGYFVFFVCNFLGCGYLVVLFVDDKQKQKGEPEHDDPAIVDPGISERVAAAAHRNAMRASAQ